MSKEKEPQIFDAIRFGSVLENVVFDPVTRVVDYDDVSLTQNTRCAYPVDFIPNAMIPCMTSSHPTNIILLTCDARGVLPLVSRLNNNQLMYHFITGYTSKVAGTEAGVDRPEVAFSACFGQPFLLLHPTVYAEMLSKKITEHKAKAWLVNTGWVGHSVNKGGRRINLKYTRAILDAIHDGSLEKAPFENFATFNLRIPLSCPKIPDKLLNPAKCWEGTEEEFQFEVAELAKLFRDNFVRFQDRTSAEVVVYTVSKVFAYSRLLDLFSSCCVIGRGGEQVIIISVHYLTFV